VGMCVRVCVCVREREIKAKLSGLNGEGRSDFHKTALRRAADLRVPVSEAHIAQLQCCPGHRESPLPCLGPPPMQGVCLL
jgi:hypothetical protein